MKEEYKKIHKEAMSRFSSCEEFYGADYQRGRDDADFCIGKQWPDDIKTTRLQEGRPCLVENRMMPFVNQVVNSIRQARPSAVVKPVDSGADVEVAEVYRGIIRNIESSSNAEVVYDTAARNSVMSGIGWIRIKTQYASYDSFDQDIVIDRIQNFESVYLDPNHERLDGSDAEYGFVYSNMEKDQFEKEYPEVDCSGSSDSSWLDENSVRVCEYFYKEYEEKELVEFQYMTIAGTQKGVSFKDDLPMGAEEIRTRKTRVCKIKYAKMCGSEVLEVGEFAGEYIPIIPVYGFETVQDGKRTFFSLIHQSKDPQKMLNYWKSAATEIVALQPKAPYIGAAGQFDSYQDQWAAANRANFPFLQYDPVTDDNGNTMPPPQRQAPPTGSGTMMQEAALSAEAIKASLGMYDASIGNQTNDISGKAIISRQMQGDNATYHFIDNLSVAIRQVGRILVGLIPVIYSGERIVRILGEDGTEQMVPLRQPVVKNANGYEVTEGAPDAFLRLDNGKYDVVVEVGSSYATRRQEAANAIIEIARVKPDILSVAGDLLLKSLDVPYGEQIANRIKATMSPELLGDDLEAQRMQQMQESLQMLQEKLNLTEQALLSKQEDQKFKNQLELKKVENQTAELQIKASETQAKIDKMRAETTEINADVMKDVATAITDLKGRYDDMYGALDVLLSIKEGEVTAAPAEAVETPEMAQREG